MRPEPDDLHSLLHNLDRRLRATERRQPETRLWADVLTFTFAGGTTDTQTLTFPEMAAPHFAVTTRSTAAISTGAVYRVTAATSTTCTVECLVPAGVTGSFAAHVLIMDSSA